MRMRCLVAALVVVQAGAAGLAADAAPAATAILDEGSYWRCHFTWRTPVVREGEALVSAGAAGGSYLSSWQAQSPAAPDGWTSADFDDTSWSRWPGPVWRLARAGNLRYSTVPMYDYGFAGLTSPCLAVVNMRGHFNVPDPSQVKGLTVSLTYRGGAVVYVNGREVGRGHLPGGVLTPDAVAEDYPAKAFEFAPGKAVRNSHGSARAYADNVTARIRRLDPVTIAPALLTRGRNVIAVEIHRAPYYGPYLKMEGLNHRSAWSTCGPVSLRLAAAAGVEPNTERPPGVQVWTESVLSRLTAADYGNPLEPLRPVRIVGVRNGVFTGKVVVSSGSGLEGVTARMGDLRQKDGGALISADAVKVLCTIRDDRMLLRYGTPVGFWDTLLEEPPAAVEPTQGLGAILPVWLKVKVPADAAPGEYVGELALSGTGFKQAVPVALKVIDWTMPDPRDFTTHMGLIQSPDSVALLYKVPLWSEAHWQRLERPFQLLGEVGNKYVVIPMICRTNFGNQESMIRWVKDKSGGYAPDFTVVERYLDLAQKYLKPDVVCLYVWDRYTGEWRWAGVGESPIRDAFVTEFDPATGQAQEMKAPMIGTPEGKAFWEPAYKGLRARLEERGLLGVTMMGMNGDAYRPTKAMFDMLKDLMPGARWVTNSHADVRGGSVEGIPVGYNTVVYVNLFPPPVRGRVVGGWRAKTDLFPRSGGPATGQPLYHSQALGVHRITMEAAFLANCSGLGRTGADFWSVLPPPKNRRTGKRSDTIIGRYPESCWNQLNMNTATEALLAIGPDGAVSSERFEMVREGVQECEARVLIEKALLAGRLEDPLKTRCQDVLEERAWLIRSGCLGDSWTWYEVQAPTVLADRLFSCAAEVARATKE